MQFEQPAQDRRDRSQVDQSTPIAIGAAVFALLLAAGGLLWTRFGESVYVERIFSAIANCF